MDYYAVKVHYFDASALVKLVADDPDEEPGREILENITVNTRILDTPFRSAWLRLSEH
jgi:hypothetical protein